MALEAPTNCWTKAQAAIVAALANSARFRDLIDSTTVSDAEKSIYANRVQNPANGHAYTLDELQELRHYAQVYASEEGAYGISFLGNGRPQSDGNHIIHIAKLVTDLRQSVELPAEIERKFENRIGDLMLEVASYMREYSGPLVRTMVVSDGPGENDRKEWESNGRWQMVDITVSWGFNSQ